MKTFRFDLLLSDDGWLSDQSVTVDDQGVIMSIGTAENDGSNVEQVNGYALPGFQNAHSHAFQYAMAGLAEIHPDPMASDDFWSWRDTMYRIALTIDPDQKEAIAAMLYSEMLRHGYTHVVEFHYLHHDKSGKPFENLSEMGERLLRAADKVGIGITLVPMFYQMGGFGQSPQDGQRRFISKDIDDYHRLLEATEKSVTRFKNAMLGHGFHSLRAVNHETAKTYFDAKVPDLPFHIHIAEQLKEVAECQAFYGARPVEWLLDNFPVDHNFHLVHATHLADEEVEGIAKSGAHVVLCPSTEGNLGDGLFPLRKFQDAGGRWSIGTDSHIGLSPMEELRILDYGQRVTTHRRNQLTSQTTGDSGQFGFDMAWRSGRAAMGQSGKKYFEIGDSFDAIVLDPDQPLISSCGEGNLLSAFVYAGDSSFIKGTITQGKWRVKEGIHEDRENVRREFGDAMKKLKIRA